MARWLYTLGICAMLAAAGVVGLWLSGRGQHSSQIEEFLNRPSAVQMFRAQGSESGVLLAEVSPLIVQAEAFARLVDPPKSPEKPSAPMLAVSATPAAPMVRPSMPSVQFKLCGTSYYSNEPGRSMALIWEPGTGEGAERWVKEETQVGHFVIHEIHRGRIVYRDGDQLREMAVEHGASVPGLVRDTRSGSRHVSSAVDEPPALSAPAGPNSVGILGGN